MKNLLLGIVLGGIISSLIWYSQTGSHKEEKEKVTDTKIVISDFIDSTQNLTGISNIIIDDSTAREYIGHYEESHDTTADSTVTYSVLFGRGACDFMAKYFLKAGAHVQGMRVYNIQYNKKMGRETNNSQKHPKQASILFVPTDGAGKPLWKEWNPSSLGEPYLKILGALNHGELCPKICPQ